MEKYIYLTGLLSITLRYVLIAGLAYLIFYKLKRNKLLHKKIQSKFPDTKQLQREIRYSALTILIFFGFFVLIRTLGMFGFSKIYWQLDAYGWFYLFLAIPLLFVLHDTYFYWTHRLLHAPWFFRFHKVHHQSTNVTPLTSFAFHPVEAVVQAGFILIVLVLPVHVLPMALFLLGQMIFNVIGHLGYELIPPRFHNSGLGSWFNTGTHHNMHHRYGHNNYSLYFNIWDKLLRTNHRHYEQNYREVALKMNKTLP